MNHLKTLTKKQKRNYLIIGVVAIIFLGIYFSNNSENSKTNSVFSTIDPQISFCEDCGIGVFNICNKKECESLGPNCEYDEGSPWVPGGKCKTIPNGGGGGGGDDGENKNEFLGLNLTNILIIIGITLLIYGLLRKNG